MRTALRTVAGMAVATTLAGAGLLVRAQRDELAAARLESRQQAEKTWAQALRAPGGRPVFEACWIATWDCGRGGFLVPGAVAPILKACTAQRECYRSYELEAVRARVERAGPAAGPFWTQEERGDLERPLRLDWKADMRR